MSIIDMDQFLMAHSRYLNHLDELKMEIDRIEKSIKRRKIEPSLEEFVKAGLKYAKHELELLKSLHSDEADKYFEDLRRHSEDYKSLVQIADVLTRKIGKWKTPAARLPVIDIDNEIKKNAVDGKITLSRLAGVLNKTYGVEDRRRTANLILRHLRKSDEYSLSVDPYYTVWVNDELPKEAKERGLVPLSDKLYISGEWLKGRENDIVGRVVLLCELAPVIERVDGGEKTIEDVTAVIKKLLPKYFSVKYDKMLAYDGNAGLLQYAGCKP